MGEITPHKRQQVRAETVHIWQRLIYSQQLAAFDKEKWRFPELKTEHVTSEQNQSEAKKREKISDDMLSDQTAVNCENR